MKFEDNLSPYLTMVETASAGVANPSAGDQKLICDTDHLLKLKNSAGVVTAIGGTPPTDATISVSDVTTNNASTGAHGWLKKLDGTATHYMDGTGAWSTPAGGGGSLSVASQILSGTPPTLNSSTFTTILTLSSLAAGTWLVCAQIQFGQASQPAGVELKLWDGATVYSSMDFVFASSGGGYPGEAFLTALAVLGSPATLTVDGRLTGSSVLVDATSAFAATPKCTQIVAVKVA